MNSTTYITNMERMMVDLVGQVQSLTKEVHDMKNKVQSDVLALKKEVEDLKSIIQERFPSVPTPSSALSFENEAKFEKEVIDFTYNSNRLGERDIIRTTPRAKAMHLATVNPSSKKATPGPPISLIAAFMDIEAARNPDPSYENASTMYGDVINLSRQIRTNIMSNQVLRSKGWTKMRAEYKRYYCLKLESLANDKCIPLYRCKDQWGADIVMAQTMKRESRIDSKETDGDVVDYRVDDRESSLDSCLVDHAYDNHNSASVSSFVGAASSSTMNRFYDQAYNDVDMDPLFSHSFSSSNSNKRNRQ